MVFQFGQYEVDIDVQRTKEFYSQTESVGETCPCDGCKNFECAVDALPKSVLTFFSDLGIDMKKICRCCVYCKNEDGSLLYGGFYHACGVARKGDSAWVKVNENLAYWENTLTFSISPNFHVSVRDKADLLEEGFPMPVIQLDILANIPWMLDTENTY